MAHLPINRTKTIMKTTEGTETISKEAVFVTTRAAEMLIKELASKGAKNLNKDKRLQYHDLVDVVHSNSQYAFLEYIIPKKITVKEYKELMRRKEEKEESSEEGSSSSEEEDSSEDSEPSN